MNPLESKKSVWLCMHSKEFLVIFGQEAERLLHIFDFFGENITAPACYILRNIIGYGGALVDQIAGCYCSHSA